MIHKIQQFLHSKRYGGPAVAVVAVAFFLIGLGVATDLHWTGTAKAERLGTSTQEAMAARTIPGSLADLVQQLTPTVVNIKVTKIAHGRQFFLASDARRPFWGILQALLPGPAQIP